MNALSHRLTPVCAEGRGAAGAKMIVPLICAHGQSFIAGGREAPGDKIKDTGYYKTPFIVTPRHLYSEGNEKSATVAEEVALHYLLCLIWLHYLLCLICLANKY